MPTGVNGYAGNDTRSRCDQLETSGTCGGTDRAKTAFKSRQRLMGCFGVMFGFVRLLG